jgi:phosphoglycolate phosphatase
MNKKVIIFDFDGTIADSMMAIVGIVNSLAPKYSYDPISEEEIKGLQNLSFSSLIKDKKISKWKWLLIFWDGRKKLQKIIARIKPFPECPEMIKKLKEQGFVLGIITSNLEKSVREFLKNNDLDYFNFVMTRNSLIGKDRTILNAIKKYNFVPEEVIYVGDEIRDIIAAKKAGVDCVAVSWGYNSRESLLENNPTYIVDRPEEILALLMADN